MINRIKALFAEGAAKAGPPEKDELQAAAAALLVEAAYMDGDFDEDERASITQLMKSHFELNDDESQTLIEEAEIVIQESGQLYNFTRVIKDRYEAEQRIEMIEMLWEVAYADGNVDHFEANLISRVAGLIYVNDRDRGDARKRVIARLGIVAS
ncbi:MAG: TerB family tellurite resistance protein [Rhodospirillaceae bacterium]|nr:TerB family tellurite resistance protein [Rhodospirillaceae bacterium]